MSAITDIYRKNYTQHGGFTYQGVLRNSKKFNIGDNIFVGLDSGTLFAGVIMGVELTPEDFSEYKYKIRIPEGSVYGRKSDGDLYDDIKIRNIFNTAEEAEASAIAEVKHINSLQLDEIDAFFKKIKNPY